MSWDLIPAEDGDSFADGEVLFFVNLSCPMHQLSDELLWREAFAERAHVGAHVAFSQSVSFRGDQ